MKKQGKITIWISLFLLTSLFISGTIVLTTFGNYAINLEKDPQRLTENEIKCSDWSSRLDGPAFSVEFSSDGEFFVAGGNDGFSYFNINNPNPLWRYAPASSIYDVDISSDGQYIFAGGSQEGSSPNLFLFDQASSNPLWNSTLGHVRSVDISSDGQYMVATDNDIHFFNKTSPIPIWSYDPPELASSVECVAISSDGQYIAAGSYGGTLYFFDTSSSTPLWTFDEGINIFSVDMVPDGSYVVIGSGDHYIHLFGKYGYHFWNCSVGTSVTSVAISSNGNYIVAGDYDGRIYYFNRTSATPLWSFNANEYIDSVAISSDGQYFVAGSHNGNVYLFNNANSNPIWTYNTFLIFSLLNGVRSVDISPDGRYIIAASLNCNTYFFDRTIIPIFQMIIITSIIAGISTIGITAFFLVRRRQKKRKSI